MASKILDIINLTRKTLNDQTFWSDEELARWCYGGIADLWRATEALNSNYNTIIKDDILHLENDEATISDVDMLELSIYKIKLIEPVDQLNRPLPSAISTFTLPFEERDYNNIDAYEAREFEPRNVNGLSYPDTIYYSALRDRVDLSMTLYVSPKIMGTTNGLGLAITYVPTLESLVMEGTSSSASRTSLFDDNVSNVPEPMEFFRPDSSIIVPSSSDGQISFGFPDADGSTISPIFSWGTVRGLAAAAVGDVPAVGNGITFPVSHAGAPLTNDLTGEADYSDEIIDTSNVVVGRTSNYQLLLAFDNQLAIDSLFPISPLKVSSLQQSVGAASGEVDIDAIIPLVGHPDHALMCWTLAHALSKQKTDRSPDFGWLSIYGQEKQNIINSLVNEPTIGHTGDAGSFPSSSSTSGTSILGRNTRVGS